jgi:peptide/nickel transport system permease protein
LSMLRPNELSGAATRGRAPRQVWHFLTRNRLLLTGFVIMTLFLIMALFPAQLAPYPPNQISLGHRLEAPGAAHLFGADDFGRDILSRVIHGARLSIFLALGIVLVSAAAGALVGMVAGYWGSWQDEVLMRFADIVLAFPPVLLAMAIVTALKPSLLNLALTLTVIAWPEYARVMRSQTLLILRRDYITAARAVGASSWRIIFRHILPNCLAPLLVQAFLNLGVTILSLAALGFLGLGAQPPTSEWGLMISEGRAYFLDAWWLPVFPGLAIALTSVSLYFIGDVLRDTLDTHAAYK